MNRRALLPKQKKLSAYVPPEVQILGSLIGTGLVDTGTGDATNYLLSTQQAFSGIDWVTVGATMADVGALAPDSTSTASTLTEITGGTPRHSIAQGFTAPVSAQYTFSISLKQGLRTRGAISLFDSYNTVNYAIAVYDLAGGVMGVAASVGGAFTSPSATITSQSNGFYLCTLTCTVNANGNYAAQVFADAGSGTGAQNLNYGGNASGPAITVWGAKVSTGTGTAYIALNGSAGAVATTVQQVFSPNGGTTAYWGTKTLNAWVGFDAGVPVTFTRYRFAPRPSQAAPGKGQWPYAPDYPYALGGAVVQTSVSDAAFGTPTTVDTLPSGLALPYYPRYALSERPLTSAAARYIRLMPPSTSFGGVSALQVFAKQGTAANACPVQPVISPMGGRFPSLSVSVSITTTTAGATIYYTTDGSTPTTSSTVYFGPFTQAIGSGSTLTIKAIAYLASLSTPTSLVTTSPLFRGYGFKPNEDEYDDQGLLVEAHSGDIKWDPNTSAYYRVGQFMNINTVFHFTTTPEPNYAATTYLYKSTDLLNWTNLGEILPNLFTTFPIGGNYNLLRNALNNNWVIWYSPIAVNVDSELFIATTAGPDVRGPWTWNPVPVATTFFNFSVLIDSDGVSAYVVWRQYTGTESTRIQQLNSSYTGLTGSPLVVVSGGSVREGWAFFKYPNVAGGTYYLISGAANPYNSGQAVDNRYIYNTGATQLVNSWSSAPGSGADAWAGFTALGTNYNGQVFFSITPQGKTQPIIGMDYWTQGNLYGSRQVWMPANIVGNTLAIQHPASWDLSTLATTYTLQALTLTGSAFGVGNAQGTVIGTVQGMLVPSWVSLTDSHSGAVQLVGGVLQVGPTPPGSAGSFNISLTETPTAGSPRTTVISITENAVGGSLSGSVTTFRNIQSVNVTTVGTTDWAAYGYNVNAASIERKSTGGSLISVLTQVGATALANFNAAPSSRQWKVTWTDGTPDASIANESYIVYCGPGAIGSGMSFTVPAGVAVQTLEIYVAVSNNATNTTTGKLTATLSDASAAQYVDTSVGTISSDTDVTLGHYTISYNAASAGQTLTLVWTNAITNAVGQNVEIYAAALH